jgi:hypothetical protein
MKAYPPLHAPGDPVSPRIKELKRSPLAAQEIAIMGTAKYLRDHDSAKIIAEPGCGKTYMGLSTCYVHADGKPHTGIVMCPPHLTLKWAREIFFTLPNTRVFLIENMRNLPLNDSVKLKAALKKPHGVMEVRLRGKEVVRKGDSFSLAALRAMGRKGLKDKLCGQNVWFIVSKERGKLGYFWRPAGLTATHGSSTGYLVNPDTCEPVEMSDGGLLSRLALDVNKKFQFEISRGKSRDEDGVFIPVENRDGKNVFSPLWTADNRKIQRMAPLEFMGRYMKNFFDYAIADEIHQLAGDTAQGNGLGILQRISNKLIGLTGTFLGGYADDAEKIIWRMDAPQMHREGFAYGEEGRKQFQSTYGVIEEVHKIESSNNLSSRNATESISIRRRPGCSPVLFGKFLMETTAFVSLEDIAENLPPYNEYPIAVAMDDELEKAYRFVESEFKKKIQQFQKAPSIPSMMLQTLLCYPDHPFDFDVLKAKVSDSYGKKCFIEICEPPELPKKKIYTKERALIEDIQSELKQGRKVQVFATFTGKHDVTCRLKQVLEDVGLRVALMKSAVPTEKREAWYAARLAEGVQVVICHPKLVETGLDLLDFPSIYFYESGYSLHTLRQASRRSWRIGQKHRVRVKFFYYAGTAQEKCVRLMGKKMLVALMMEGKMSGEGLQDLDEGDDMMTEMVKELLDKGGVGESADEIWNSLERERKVFTDAALSNADTSNPSHDEIDAALDLVASSSDLVPSSAPTSVSDIAQDLLTYANPQISEQVVNQNGLAFMSVSKPRRKSKPKPSNDIQMSLF